jgi:hypothetical protein
MVRKEEKEQAEGLIIIYLTIPGTQAYNQSVVGPLCDPALLSTHLFLPHWGLVPAATMVVILRQHAPGYDKGKRCTNRGWFQGVEIGNLLQ